MAEPSRSAFEFSSGFDLLFVWISLEQLAAAAGLRHSRGPFIPTNTMLVVASGVWILGFIWRLEVAEIPILFIGVGCWMMDVGCWMLDVFRFPLLFPLRTSAPALRALRFPQIRSQNPYFPSLLRPIIKNLCKKT